MLVDELNGLGIVLVLDRLVGEGEMIVYWVEFLWGEVGEESKKKKEERKKKKECVVGGFGCGLIDAVEDGQVNK